MPTFPAYLFVKEPGKTRTLFVEEENLAKNAKDLKLAEILEIKKDRDKVLLLTKDKKVAAEIENKELAAKIGYAFSLQAVLQAVFVKLIKVGSNHLRAQFILRSSLPIFANERSSDLKPFLRGQPLADMEKPTDEIAGDDEVVHAEETNPLSGLNLTEDDKPTPLDEE